MSISGCTRFAGAAGAGAVGAIGAGGAAVVATATGGAALGWVAMTISGAGMKGGGGAWMLGGGGGGGRASGGLTSSMVRTSSGWRGIARVCVPV